MTLCVGCEALPSEARGARVNVLDGDERKHRLGRLDFRFDPATSLATASKGETVHASGTVVSVVRTSSNSWQLTMGDGTTWVMLEGGCGCGG